MTADALIGLIMLLVLLGAIFIGVPIAFTLLFLAFAFGYAAIGHTVFDLAYFQTIGMMKEELLAAVPLFIFMGFITEQAGLMERLFTAFRMLLAPVRGALFLVVILTSTVFAMATGIVTFWPTIWVAVLRFSMLTATRWRSLILRKSLSLAR